MLKACISKIRKPLAISKKNVKLNPHLPIYHINRPNPNHTTHNRVDFDLLAKNRPRRKRRGKRNRENKTTGFLGAYFSRGEEIHGSGKCRYDNTSKEQIAPKVKVFDLYQTYNF